MQLLLARKHVHELRSILSLGYSIKEIESAFKALAQP